MPPVQRTPLYDEHRKAHARLVDFHGWEMPVWYHGIIEEHRATRQAAGLFDTSHMGEFLVRGPHAAALLNQVLTIDVPDLEQDQVKYTFLLNETGGIIDDLMVSCLQPDAEYFLCVNASNTVKDLAWLHAHNSHGAHINDISPQTAMLALQGPQAGGILQQSLGFNLGGLHRFHIISLDSPFGGLRISRTGYTGADGVEIFLENAQAADLWRALLAAGAQPCGLGARDTLRLEMGYPLHGNDIDEQTTPLEASLAFALNLNKENFIGREALLRQQKEGIRRKLAGLILEEKGVPRQGCLCMQEGRQAGIVTSGSVSPVLNTGIALAYLDTSLQVGDTVDIMIRSKAFKARVCKPPFIPSPLKHKPT